MDVVNGLAEIVSRLVNYVWNYFKQDLLRYGTPVVLRTHTGRFVRIKENGQLCASTKNIDEAAIFYIVHPNEPFVDEPREFIFHNSLISLRHDRDGNGMFVSAREKEQDMIVGLYRRSCDSWETFHILGVGASRKQKREIFLKYGTKVGFISHHGKRLAYDTEQEHRYFATHTHIPEKFRDSEYVFLIKRDKGSA